VLLFSNTNIPAIDIVTLGSYLNTQGIKIQYIGAPQAGDIIAAAADDSIK